MSIGIEVKVWARYATMSLGVRDAYLTGLKSRSCQHSQCASRRVSRSASASHCSAHSIGFVTLWMLANPFFGFVGYVPVLNTFSIRFRTGVTPRLELSQQLQVQHLLGVGLGVCGMDHPAGTRLVLAAASPPSGRSCWHGHYVGLYDVG